MCVRQRVRVCERERGGGERMSHIGLPQSPGLKRFSAACDERDGRERGRVCVCVCEREREREEEERFYSPFVGNGAYWTRIGERGEEKEGEGKGSGCGRGGSAQSILSKLRAPTASSPAPTTPCCLDAR